MVYQVHLIKVEAPEFDTFFFVFDRKLCIIASLVAKLRMQHVLAMCNELCSGTFLNV